MPKKEYALEVGGPKRLVLSWTGIWKNLEVRLDQQLIGTIENQKALKEGKTFALPDRSQLKVILVTGMGAELQLSRDGVPLPGSNADPEERVKQAYWMIFVIAGLNGILGLVAVLGQVEFLLNMGLGWESLVMAAIYGGLGFLVKSTRSAVALGLAVGLFGLDAILTLATTVGAGGTPPIGGLIARIFFLVPMVRAFPAIRELKNKPPVTQPLNLPDDLASRGQPWEPPKNG